MKNYLKEYNEFIEEQQKLNKDCKWTENWEGWIGLYLVHKLKKVDKE